MRIVLYTIAFAALGTSAFAVDFPEMRPAYPTDWHTGEDNPLRFEAGVRYWYSLGEQNHAIGTATQNMQTKNSSGEVFARVDDGATKSFLEGTAGYGFAYEGTYSSNNGTATSLPAARLGYVGADFGWLPWGGETAGVGFITGYQFLNDSPDTGRANFIVTPTVVDNGGGNYSIGGGGDSEINNFDIHMLKLGFAGKADMGALDLQAEAAAIPYAWVSGTYGSYAIPGQNTGFRQSSAAEIKGQAFGASGKLMVGVHPTENLSIRVGGRATYLNGQYDATYDAVRLVPNGPDEPTLASQRYISNNNPFNLIRYGALLEVSGRF